MGRQVGAITERSRDKDGGEVEDKARVRQNVGERTTRLALIGPYLDADTDSWPSIIHEVSITRQLPCVSE